MKQALIRPIAAIVPRTGHGFGGKALHLAALARAGFPVPAGYALRTEASEAFYAANLEPEERPARLFAATVLPDDAVLENIRARLRRAPVPEEIAAALRRAFSSLKEEGAEAVAVRSSSTGEDQDSASAAGLHLSFLQIRDEQALLDAVRTCWAGVFRSRVLTYLRTLGANPNAAMGVIIQAMVPAEVAGVLFTVNPVTGDDREMVLNAAYGLGCGVTDGLISPDTYRIDKASGWIRDRVIGDKRLRVVAATAGGVQEQGVSEDDAPREALDEHTLRQLIALGQRVERFFRSPRDVEWAVTHDGIYLLQARPIAASEAPLARSSTRRKGVAEDDPARHVWSNVNVGEALPGVATPLTWSVMSNFSGHGFRKAFEALGCRVPNHAALVGNFRGRIYLNLTEMAHVAAQAPGMTPERIAALAGGVSVPVDWEEARRGRRGFWMRLPLTVARYVRDQLRFDRTLAVHDRNFAIEIARIQAIDLRILDAAALDHTLTDVERLLDETGGFMLTAYGQLLAVHVLLLRLLELVGVRPADQVMRNLSSTLEDVESARPAQELSRIADLARREPEVVRIMQQGVATLGDVPQGPTRAALTSFLNDYGYRGVREAELAEPRWAEDPSTLLSALAGMVRSDARTPRSGPQDVDALLRAVLPLPVRVSPLRSSIADLVKLQRRYLRLREHLRAQVVRILGSFRTLALETSRRILAREPESGDGAAFFLTLPEIHAYLRGHRSLVSPAVRRRRLQYDRDVSLPDPPDTFVGYPPMLDEGLAPVAHLQGLGACGGVAEGPARVLHSPSEFAQFLPGEILIVRHADVGWSPLFLIAAGVVTDIGGPLSHAAVILREYGVPAVFNAAGATRQIHSGSRVRLNGDSGLVEVVGRTGDRQEALVAGAGE